MIKLEQLAETVRQTLEQTEAMAEVTVQTTFQRGQRPLRVTSPLVVVGVGPSAIQSREDDPSGRKVLATVTAALYLPAMQGGDRCRALGLRLAEALSLMESPRFQTVRCGAPAYNENAGCLKLMVEADLEAQVQPGSDGWEGNTVPSREPIEVWVNSRTFAGYAKTYTGWIRRDSVPLTRLGKETRQPETDLAYGPACYGFTLTLKNPSRETVQSLEGLSGFQLEVRWKDQGETYTGCRWKELSFQQEETGVGSLTLSADASDRDVWSTGRKRRKTDGGVFI